MEEDKKVCARDGKVKAIAFNLEYKTSKDEEYGNIIPLGTIKKEEGISISDAVEKLKKAGYLDIVQRRYGLKIVKQGLLGQEKQAVDSISDDLAQIFGEDITLDRLL